MANNEESAAAGTGKKTLPRTVAAAKKAAKKAAAKKAGRRARKTAESPSHPITRSPELLAKLALQILQLDPGGVRDQINPAFPVSDPKLDRSFHRALKRAELLLKAAGGESDETVHAYQVFREGEPPSSLHDIAQRLEEAGWKKLKSRNTVERWIEDLVRHADEKIVSHLDFIDLQLSRAARSPTSHSDLRSRFKRHIRRLLHRNSFTDVLKDPNDVADQVALFLIERIDAEIPARAYAPIQEKWESHAGYATFAGYVLDPPSVEEFLGEEHFPPLSIGLLQAFAFMFRELGDQTKFRPVDLAQIRVVQTLLVHSGDIPVGIPEDLKQLASLAEQLGDRPISRPIKALAASIAAKLLENHERWHLSLLLRIQPIAQLKEEIRRYRSASAATQPGEGSDILDQLVAAFSAPEPEANTASSHPLGHQEQLDGIFRLVEAAVQEVRTCSEIGLSEVLLQIKGSLEKNRTTSKGDEDLRSQLSIFFRRTLPSKANRKIRAYEIFLFAAQNDLLPDRLVRRRRDLNKEFIPSPPHWTYLSILSHHGGHPFETPS